MTALPDQRPQASRSWRRKHCRSALGGPMQEPTTSSGRCMSPALPPTGDLPTIAWRTGEDATVRDSSMTAIGDYCSINHWVASA